MNAQAYLIAENLNIKKFKQEFEGELISFSNIDLFYKYKNGYFYLINYGVVAFANSEEEDRNFIIHFIEKFVSNPLDKTYSENFVIEENQELSFNYNSIMVPKLTPQVIRMVLLLMAESVALDFYMESAQQIFDKTTEYTTQLELHGKLSAGKKELLKIIGKALNTKNRIIDNLYVIDTPPSVWEDEMLEKVHNGLQITFDINIRFREVEYMMKSIEGNLSILIELTNVRESKILELVIIALILVEVLNLFLKW